MYDPARQADAKGKLNHCFPRASFVQLQPDMSGIADNVMFRAIVKHRHYSSLLMLVCSLNLAGCQTDSKLACVYTPRQSAAIPYPELTRYDNCAIPDHQGGMTITAQHLANMSFDEHDLAAIHINKAYYYVHRSGKVARTHPFDNGADYFQSGLARTTQNGKFGYIDRQLNIVIQPVYDFAFPFNGEHAVVCNGCISISDGEHKKWLVANGVISIKPVRLSSR